MKLKYVVIYLFCALLTACASFPGEQVAKVQIPSMAHYQNKPSVYVDFHFYMGESTDPAPVPINDTRNVLGERLEQLLKDSNLFEYYTLDKKERKPNDYVIKLDVYNHASQVAIIPACFITGLTLYIIPCYGTDNYTMKWQVTSPNQQIITTKQNDDYMKTWLGIWFLPVLKNTHYKAITETFDRQVNDMLKQLVDQKVFEYSNEVK